MKRVTLILLLLCLLVIPSGVTFAENLFDTSIEETINNDVVIFSEDLEVKENVVVNGDVVVLSGDAYIAGTINGDVVLFSGNMEATETAVIDGTCVLFSGTISVSSDNVNCIEVSDAPDFIGALPDLPNLPIFAPEVGDIDVRIPSAASIFWTNFAEAVTNSLILGLLAFVMASVLPQHLNRVEETIADKTIVSGTVGFLTAVAVPSLVALLLPVSIILTFVCVGLLGFPIMLALMAGLLAAGVFGWITLGAMLGRRLNLGQSRPMTTALGTMVLTFGLGLLGAIPFVIGEGLITTLLVCVGLGATALTQFGTKPYHRPEAITAPAEDKMKVAAVLDTLPPDDDTA